MRLTLRGMIKLMIKSHARQGAQKIFVGLIGQCPEDSAARGGGRALKRG
jgi:hypothetical protein